MCLLVFTIQILKSYKILLEITTLGLIFKEFYKSLDFIIQKIEDTKPNNI